jgi:inorganic triphosphatase YgiF
LKHPCAPAKNGDGSPRAVLRLHLEAGHLRRLPRIAPVREYMRGSPRTGAIRAIYFDTPDLALRENGITLCLTHERRTWKQVLACEAAGRRRLPYKEEWPLRRPSPDLSLAESSVLGRVFKKKRIRCALAPVFSIRSRRTGLLLDLGEGCTAEMYLTLGELTSGSRREQISEAEVEVITGPPDRLLGFGLDLSDTVPLRIAWHSPVERGYRLFLGRPEPPRKGALPALRSGMAATRAMKLITAACVQQMHANAPGFLDGGSPEHLHQLRTGWQRLRSALSMPRDSRWKEALEPLRPELRWLSRTLSAARNWDVLATELLPPVMHDLRPGSGPNRALGLAAMRGRCARLRKRYGETARDAVRSDRCSRLMMRIERLVAAMPSAKNVVPEGLGGSAKRFAVSVLNRRERKLQRTAQHLSSAAARHRVRIAAKKLRYTGEFFASFFGKRKARRYLARLADLQDLLGALNDAATGAALLDEAGRSGRAGVQARVTQVIAGRLVADETDRLRRLGEAWKRFSTQEPFWVRG